MASPAHKIIYLLQTMEYAFLTDKEINRVIKIEDKFKTYGYLPDELINELESLNKESFKRSMLWKGK